MKLSPFGVEYRRQHLAQEGKLKELKDTYSKSLPEISDLNTRPFWNERLEVRTPLAQADGMTQKRAKTVAKWLPRSVESLLDIGIGAGWVEELLEKRNLKLYGTDISDATIKNVGNRFKDGKFWVENLYDLPTKDHVIYDAVLLLEVLEHVPPSKTFGVLKNIKSVLRPNGWLIVSVPTNEGLDHMSDNPNGHVRMYTVPLLHAELALAGFRVRQTKTLYAFPNLYRLKQLIASIWRSKWKPNNIIVLAQNVS
jgi:2-polyprenyl-3-methyl-5-hydroxy-6-metoxy-1,4-benzoquinol methylase